MSKVIMFSRVFPKYHPKAGEPTFFVEKILKHFLDESSPMFPYWMKNHESETDIRESYDFEPKIHTIRAGNRFKAGEKFSPRVWSGKPYASKQIIIAPDLQIKRIWDYEVKVSKGVEQWFLNRIMVSESNECMQQWFNCNLIKQIAKNDGLEVSDFLNWFKHPSNFSGQIICWSDSVEY